MYRYDEFDHKVVQQRITQFRQQVERRVDGSLTEDEFKPLRLMNGLYLQLHAYMLRVAIPYGTLSSQQMHQLAYIADKFDRGFGHFTTRQNIQFNWPKLAETPDILEALAAVEMHAIQTSGNCIRNVTSDPLAGAVADEIADPRPTAEMLRQWSSLHPEFSYLPRKFKIAVTGSANDRVAARFHDIGLRMLRNDAGETGYEVLVGGGQGRTPVIGEVLRSFLPSTRLLDYLEALMRVYNLHGRRDNKYKARIKILVRELGVDAFRAQVDAAFDDATSSSATLAQAELERIDAYFAPPAFADLPHSSAEYEAAKVDHPGFARWVDTNVLMHKHDSYAIAMVTLKATGAVPGDATSAQMRTLADIAAQYSFAELRVSIEQNIVLPHVAKRDLFAVWARLNHANLASANHDLITDIIACPGMDYCALATARSIPLAQDLSRRFAAAERQQDIGPLNIKISGCINACGHHHVGHIGILGADKAGKEYYQLTLGGDPSGNAAIGERAGRGFAPEEIVDAVETVVDHYLARRANNETFTETYRRLGADSFKEVLYGTH
jgi:sulfite reductase (NADPH) hemoprotein beta-component